MFRVIIAGGRDFDDYELLKSTMDSLSISKVRYVLYLVQQEVLICLESDMPMKKVMWYTVFQQIGALGVEQDLFAMRKWLKTQMHL